MWILFTRSDGGVSYCSAFRLNERFALTAAHCVQDSGVLVTNVSAGTSANRLTPETGEIRQVVRIFVHPTYNGSIYLSDLSADLALLQFDQPLPGIDAVIGSVTPGEIISGVGYGLPGTTSAGFWPEDGKRRAYQMATRSGSNGTIRNNYPFYFLFWFWPQVHPLPLAGAAMPGDSGSGMLNPAGELVAVAKSASPRYPYDSVTNGALRLYVFADWIKSIIDPHLSIQHASGNVHLSWNAAAMGWKLKTSTDLLDWDDVGGALTGPGTLDEPLNGRPQLYYRLAKAPPAASQMFAPAVPSIDMEDLKRRARIAVPGP